MALPAGVRSVRRDALGVGLATGAYGVSFGALSVAAGLSVTQTAALSILMFTGASQFALVGVIGTGGNPLAGAATAILLGVRNGLYGLALAPVLRVRGIRRIAAAHLMIDESAAMAVGHEDPRLARLAYWATGLAVFVCWNAATLVGGLGAESLSDPTTLGLDAAAPAAFLALLAPRLHAREPWMVALLAALVALVTTPFLSDGLPVLCAALVAVIAGIWWHDPLGGLEPDDAGETS